MGSSDVEAVIAAQAALIAALDGGDVAMIERATAALSETLDAVRGKGGVHDVGRHRVDHALAQSEAARMRVNFMADRTRQRLDRLAARRGVRTRDTYTKRGLLAVFGR